MSTTFQQRGRLLLVHMIQRLIQVELQTLEATLRLPRVALRWNFRALVRFTQRL